MNSRPGHTVLIVEDSENSAATLEMAAADIPGVTVLLAASGLAALAFLDDPRQAIDVLITDLNMPHLDGFELIERVRAHPRYRNVAIVVVSADTDPRTPARIERLGANAFFPKPYSPSQVRRKLEQLLCPE
jgi:two-component system, chemotaxis family, chemotaxis protein CheY